MAASTWASAFGSSDGEEEKVGRQERRKGTLTLAAAAAAKPVKKMQSCYATKGERERVTQQEVAE